MQTEPVQVDIGSEGAYARGKDRCNRVPELTERLKLVITLCFR